MPSEMRRLREAEEENGRLKRIVADFSPGSMCVLHEAHSRKALSPAMTQSKSSAGTDLAPGRYSLITGVRSGYGPTRTSLQTRSA
jgi:hypothetical protein